MHPHRIIPQLPPYITRSMLHPYIEIRSSEHDDMLYLYKEAILQGHKQEAAVSALVRTCTK